jgi:putative ABC transport system permease protein
VHSRIHEIGVRKAIGATTRSILLQFLSEAVMIALLGGAVGTTIGLALPISVQLLTGYPIPVSFLSAFIALTVSCAVGVIFGITPAKNAARLDPVEALRRE